MAVRGGGHERNKTPLLIRGGADTTILEMPENRTTSSSRAASNSKAPVDLKVVKSSTAQLSAALSLILPPNQSLISSSKTRQPRAKPPTSAVDSPPSSNDEELSEVQAVGERNREIGQQEYELTGLLKNYELKKWHHDVNKPIIYGIHKEKGKPRHFLDDILKAKKIVPPPNTYDTSRTFVLKQNMMHSKSPRVTMAVEIEKTVKKNAFPEPATYKPSTSYRVEPNPGLFQPEGRALRIPGRSQSHRQAAGALRGQELCLGGSKSKYPKIYNPIPAKPVEKVNLSPTSYNFDESYKSTQLQKPKFYISKYKYENYISKAVKQKKWVPGSGAYDVDKGKSF
eukprot:CAMPEP_0170506206 /NCGR_PEP_ID=MMETSP0208-20121228/54036_1 /TAXON_ID=197538 /ORGANISM="Strombidium inclinatum, Strain S3" /LENGTH=339 /DNA_ID=CAMNT_0010787583 /DNA_START=392 /DNA_END=1411 /DNA_ORIENTATION=+